MEVLWIRLLSTIGRKSHVSSCPLEMQEEFCVARQIRLKRSKTKRGSLAAKVGVVLNLGVASNLVCRGVVEASA